MDQSLWQSAGGTVRQGDPLTVNTSAFRGRKTSRVKSERRRKAILEAAIRVAAREGIRGIKHRAVAAEARVPLAATTYYFRDINELVNDAFALFAVGAQQQLQVFYEALTLVLDGLQPDQLLRDSNYRSTLAERLTQISLAWMQDQFSRRRDQVLAEQVFVMEALRDERLAVVARRYRQFWIDGLERLLSRLDSPLPRQDATLIVNVVLGMSYDLLLEIPGAESEVLSASVERIVQLALGIQPKQ